MSPEGAQLLASAISPKAATSSIFQAEPECAVCASVHRGGCDSPAWRRRTGRPGANAAERRSAEPDRDAGGLSSLVIPHRRGFRVPYKHSPHRSNRHRDPGRLGRRLWRRALPGTSKENRSNHDYSKHRRKQSRLSHRGKGSPHSCPMLQAEGAVGSLVRARSRLRTVRVKRYSVFALKSLLPSTFGQIPLVRLRVPTSSDSVPKVHLARLLRG